MHRFYIYPTIVMAAGVGLVVSMRLDENLRREKNREKNMYSSRMDTIRRSVPISDSDNSRVMKHSDLSRDELHAAIHRSARYLIHTNQENGQFVYRQYLDGRSSTKIRYNMLRHAGVLYSLAEYYDWQTDDTVLAVLQRGVDFMRSQLAVVPTRPDVLALWSNPDVTGSKSLKSAKLGGAGLALVTLARLRSIDPNAVSLDEMRRLGEFIGWMQKGNGEFYSKYLFSERDRTDAFVSLYYPGEAILGLTMLYEADPQPMWLEIAYNGLSFLARSRAGQSTVPADHWALIATSQILPHLSNLPATASHERLVEHALQICTSILSERSSLPVSNSRLGGFVWDGRTCPTATRLEGLLSCLEFMPKQQNNLHVHMVDSIRDGMDFLLKTQVRSGPNSGAMPRAIGRLPGEQSVVNAEFNRRVVEVRMDYVQHAMCAMIAYDQLWFLLGK